MLRGRYQTVDVVVATAGSIGQGLVLNVKSPSREQQSRRRLQRRQS